MHQGKSVRCSKFFRDILLPAAVSPANPCPNGNDAAHKKQARAA
jgi:hypothetical protein